MDEYLIYGDAARKLSTNREKRCCPRWRFLKRVLSYSIYTTLGRFIRQFRYRQNTALEIKYVLSEFIAFEAFLWCFHPQSSSQPKTHSVCSLVIVAFPPVNAYVFLLCLLKKTLLGLMNRRLGLWFLGMKQT